MIAYATRALGAQFRGGRVLFFLAVAGVALGVASVLSIQILNRSAVGAFAGGIRAISGDAQLSIVGRGPTLSDDLLPSVLGEPGVRAAIPIERVDVALDGGGGLLEVVGTDLFAPLRARWDLPRDRLAEVLTRRGWVAVGPQLATGMGWQRGTKVLVSSGSRRVALEVGAVIDFRKVAPLASSRLAVMDLAQVQALLGAPGRLTQIDVIATPGTDVAALARRLEARLGPGVRATTPEQRVTEADALLAAFRLNLTALSLVSLLVGGFLVHASTQAALARRREEMGILRCLGATRAQVLTLVLGDAAVLGALGTAVGVPLGWLAARANVRAVSATVRTVYLLEGIEHVTLTPGLVAVGVAVGMAGAVAGAFVPALDLAREDPRALLSRRAPPTSGRSARRLALAGALLVVLAAAVVLGPARGWRSAGFVLALAVLAAVPLAAPLLLGIAGRFRAPRRLGLAYGARDLAGHLRSTAVSAGALGVAVSMLAGITVMIGSFRHTVEDWLSATLRADIYVTTPSWRRGGRSEAALDPRIVQTLAQAPEVRSIDRLRQVYGDVDGARVSISGFDSGAGDAGRVDLLAPRGAAGEAALRTLARDAAVLVSEPLARKRGLQVGSRVTMAGPRGPVSLPVAGIYRDYGAEQGAVLMDLATLESIFAPGRLTNVALRLVPGQDVDRVVERLKAELSGDALLIRSNRRLREDVLAVFEQTFAVTRLLQAMSLLVAVCGVALSLLVLARERSAEVALYRALGAVRGQIFRVFVGRALGIAVAGLALGAAGGAALSLVLVAIINPAWFGWSIGLHWPWRMLAGQALLLLAAALAASVYPAARASNTPATELARDAL